MPSMRQRYLQKPVSGRMAGAVWIGTLALFVVYLDYIAPLKAMGGGAVHLDIRFGGYDLATVNAYFATLGETGRAFYRTTTLFDTVWPLAAAISGFLMAPLAFRRGWLALLFAFFPVSFGVLDLFENIGLLTMLAQYPDVTHATAAIANGFTLVKQTMLPGATVSFLTLPLFALARFFKERSAGAPAQENAA